MCARDRHPAAAPARGLDGAGGGRRRCRLGAGESRQRASGGLVGVRPPRRRRVRPARSAVLEAPASPGASHEGQVDPYGRRLGGADRPRAGCDRNRRRLVVRWERPDRAVEPAEPTHPARTARGAGARCAPALAVSSAEASGLRGTAHGRRLRWARTRRRWRVGTPAGGEPSDRPGG